MITHTIYLARDHGTDLSSRHRAATLRTQMLEWAENPEVRIEIDFANVRVVSDSFADELFGILVLWRGDDWFREHVRVLNLRPVIRYTILSTVAERQRLAVKT